MESQIRNLLWDSGEGAGDDVTGMHVGPGGQNKFEGPMTCAWEDNPKWISHPPLGSG